MYKYLKNNLLMRVLLQRVISASVEIERRETAKIGRGLLVFVGIGDDDTADDTGYLVDKINKLRIFDDENGVMNLSVKDIGGEILVVSQFTLMASTKKGNRPSYIKAARPEVSVPIYEEFLALMEQALGRRVERGVFGADMKVSLVNDGPVTIWIDSKT